MPSSLSATLVSVRAATLAAVLITAFVANSAQATAPPANGTGQAAAAPASAAAPVATAADNAAAARHARRTACLKEARTKKLVGANRTAYVKKCVGPP